MRIHAPPPDLRSLTVRRFCSFLLRFWDDSESSVVDDVLTALQQGVLVPELSAKSQLDDAQAGKAMWGLLSPELSGNFSVLEICGGRSLVSLFVARRRPLSTVISVQPGAAGEATLDVTASLRDRLQVQNLLLAYGADTVADSLSLIRKAQSPLGAPLQFSYALASDLNELVGELLPHEFEHLLGALMLHAGTTFIGTPLPNTRFFSYWADPDELVKSAVRALKTSGVHLEITTRDLKQTRQWGDTSPEVSFLRVQVLTQNTTLVEEDEDDDELLATNTTKASEKSDKDENTSAPTNVRL